MALLAAFALDAAAEDYAIGDLAIRTPWARATPPSASMAAGYLTIVNQGAEPDFLVGASSAQAASVELHESASEDGVMQMRRVERLEIAPGDTVVLEPGGLHLMIAKPTDRLREGDRFRVTLAFEEAGTVTLDLAVQSIGAMKPEPEND